MKILHVNRSDIEGGAARAAFRLQKAIKYYESETYMLVDSKSSDDNSVIGPITKLEKGIKKLRPTLDSFPVQSYKNRTQSPFSPSWLPSCSTVKKINNMNPDIVHLHWVTGGMLRIEDIADIEAPIVWSLHDNWAFTGGCHIMWQCINFKFACGRCPRLDSKKDKDISRKIFLRKKSTFQEIGNLTIVGLSQWMAQSAKESTLFYNRNVYCLPNPIDSDKFSPFDKEMSRNLLNLPMDKKIILFGAMSGTSDPNKGFDKLSKALEKITSKNTHLAVFGSSQADQATNFPQKAHYLGHLHDDISLRILYCAVDVMVVPSYQEAFGQTATEAMACGTPVVAFGATGLLDIVDHKKNGYLAQPFDAADLARGMDWILNYEEYEWLRTNAREKVVNNFDYRTVAPKYIDLYRSVLEEERI